MVKRNTKKYKEIYSKKMEMKAFFLIDPIFCSGETERVRLHAAVSLRCVLLLLEAEGAGVQERCVDLRVCFSEAQVHNSLRNSLDYTIYLITQFTCSPNSLVHPIHLFTQSTCSPNSLIYAISLFTQFTCFCNSLFYAIHLFLQFP